MCRPGRYRGLRFVGLVITVAAGLAACAPAAVPDTQRGGAASGQAAPAAEVPQRVVTIVLRAEPPNMSERLDRMGLGFPVSVTLAYRDATEAVRPMLAERLPSQSAGTWTVKSDGTMRTVWTLKPGLKWHDGQPLTAADFAFAHTIYTDAEIPVSTRLPESLMSEVLARDDRTLEITWRQTYVAADALVDNQLTPLPRHILLDLYSKDKPAFSSSSFWTSEEFVGSGPYQVARWVRGVVITLTANPHFPLGKPKIETLEIKSITDANTIVAGFLAGSIDFAEYTAIQVEQGLILRERWQPDNGGAVYAESLFGPRYMEFQHRDVPAHQRALTDVRVRRALIHALDRQALTDALQQGFGDVADTGYPKSAAIYPKLEKVISRYPYDLRRTQELLSEAGWTRGPEGMYRDAQGRTLDVEARVTGEREQEVAIVAADWKGAGINASAFVVPRALTTDVEYRVNFPGVAISASTEVVSAFNVTTGQAPTAQNRFTGKNRGSYSNPELDRLYELSLLTLDPSRREEVLLEIERIFTADVAQGMLFYQPRVAAVRAGIAGLNPPVRGTYTWNIWEWRLT